MRVSFLKQILSMYHDDVEVLIQTVPADLCSPLDTRHFSMMRAYIDERSKCLEKEKLLLTAYHPADTVARLPAKDGIADELLAALVLAFPFVEGKNYKIETDIRNAINKARAP